MGYREVEWAMAQPLRSHTDKIVLAAIARYAKGDKPCWPSQRRLMEDTGLSERAVRYATRHLEDAGIIATDFRGGERGVRKRSSMYRLCVPVSELLGHDLPQVGAQLAPHEPVNNNLPSFSFGSPYQGQQRQEVEAPRTRGAAPALRLIAGGRS
jgi:DNA-binding transcriptional ArsR family regulator